jgi:biopolymer transport protein ExbD
MKMKGAKQVHYDSGPNMTPLVDVVMVILIFLMLAGQFGSGSQFLFSKQGIHQKGSGGGKVDPDQPPDIDVQINAAEVGFTATVPGARPTHSAEAVKVALDAIREKYIKQGIPNSKLQVVLYPSGMLKHQYVIQVYDAALRANFEKVAFATEH